MILPQITHLYLYKAPCQFTLKIFEDAKLWASKPEHFNDPFDCDVEVTKGITEEDVMHTIHAQHGHQREAWPSQIVKVVDSMFDADGKFYAGRATASGQGSSSRNRRQQELWRGVFIRGERLDPHVVPLWKEPHRHLHRV